MSLKSYLVQTWRVEGMGLSFHHYLDWKNKTLFRRFPAHCQICDWEWRPDRSEQFIDVFGTVSKDKDFGYAWYCGQLDVKKPTGHLDDHIRKVCIRHKDLRDRVIDNLTGCYVDLVDKDWLAERTQDFKYWSRCIFRFVKEIVLDVCFGLIHPIRAYRWWKAWYASK